MQMPKEEALFHVEMKTRWAQRHFDALQRELDIWIDSPAYTVSHKDDVEHSIQLWRVVLKATPEAIPMLLSAFISSLRSALDNLAWGLAHLDTARVFTERDERNISFLIFKDSNSTYTDRRLLFPPTVANEFDKLQPYLRGNAYRDDPLWQLNELWTLDKHRSVPVNSHSLNVRFPMNGWQYFLRNDFDYGFEVHFPLRLAQASQVTLEPTISMEVLFGERMGSFEVSMKRLGEINDFVRNDVIPRFAGFFT